MTALLDLLAVLQHGDSQFPSGGFAFSWGLEGLHAENLMVRQDLAAFLEGQFCHRWGSFERVLIARAHAGAGDLDLLTKIDERADALTLAETAREGSKRAGSALLGVHVRLGTTHAKEFRQAVLDRRAHGHAPVVQGLVLAGTGLGLTETLAVAAHASATAFCTAAIRLGLASHLDAQKALARLRPQIARILALPLPSLEEASAFTPAAEIAMMRHAGQHLRLFSN